MDSNEIWPQTSVGDWKDLGAQRSKYIIIIDELSLFGSPFPAGIESNDKYKLYFYNRVNADIGFRDSVMTLIGKTLYVYGPKPNNATVIADYLNSLADEHNKKLSDARIKQMQRLSEILKKNDLF